MVRISAKEVGKTAKGIVVVWASILTAIAIVVMYFMQVAALSKPDYAWLFNMIYWIFGLYIIAQLLFLLLVTWKFPKLFK